MRGCSCFVPLSPTLSGAVAGAAASYLRNAGPIRKAESVGVGRLWSWAQACDVIEYAAAAIPRGRSVTMKHQPACCLNHPCGMWCSLAATSCSERAGGRSAVPAFTFHSEARDGWRTQDAGEAASRAGLQLADGRRPQFRRRRTENKRIRVWGGRRC